MDKENIIKHYCAKAERAVRRMSRKGIGDIYAISFWKDNVDDDPRRPVVTIGYNTVSHAEAQKQNASNAMEAKWNYAYWMQDDTGTLGGNDTMLRLYFKDEGLFYTLHELNKAEKQEENGNPEGYRMIEEKDRRMQEAFMDIVIEVANRLQRNEPITRALGRDLPIIIHELEYYDQPVGWTAKANPTPLVAEFMEWYRSFAK